VIAKVMKSVWESDEVDESDMEGKTLNRWGTGLYGIQYDGDKKPSRLDV